jgi:hypothetical protein
MFISNQYKIEFLCEKLKTVIINYNMPHIHRIVKLLLLLITYYLKSLLFWDVMQSQ